MKKNTSEVLCITSSTEKEICGKFSILIRGVNIELELCTIS